jgi:uncharacterized protein YerC
LGGNINWQSNMPKVSRNKLKSEDYKAILDNLIIVFGDLKNKQDVIELFEKLFTRTEKLMIAKRLAIAMLLERNLSYSEISKILKVSSTTISFVRNGIMQEGSVYEKLIEKLNRIKYIS